MHTPQGKEERIGMSSRALPLIMVENTPSNFMTGVEVATAAPMVHMQAHNSHHSVGRLYGVDPFAMSGGYQVNEQ